MDMEPKRAIDKTARDEALEHVAEKMPPNPEADVDRIVDSVMRLMGRLPNEDAHVESQDERDASIKDRLDKSFAALPLGGLGPAPDFGFSTKLDGVGDISPQSPGNIVLDAGRDSTLDWPEIDLAPSILGEVSLPLAPVNHVDGDSNPPIELPPAIISEDGPHRAQGTLQADAAGGFDPALLGTVTVRNLPPVIVSCGEPVTAPGQAWGPREITAPGGEVLYRPGDPFPLRLLQLGFQERAGESDPRRDGASEPSSNVGVREGSPLGVSQRAPSATGPDADPSAMPAPIMLVSTFDVERFQESAIEAVSQRMESAVREIVRYEIHEDNAMRDAELRGLLGDY